MTMEDADFNYLNDSYSFQQKASNNGGQSIFSNKSQKPVSFAFVQML